MDDIFFKNSNIFYNILCFLISENEKLFDRSDSRLYWYTVCHLFGILHHAYVGMFATEITLKLKPSPELDLDNLYKFRIGYLTGWNFTFQSIFLMMSLAYDILEWLDHHQTNIGKKLKYYRDIIFSGLVWPVTVFISTFFWTIYWIDRELVFPEIYDQLVPWWFNHCVHTNILIVIAIETLLQARRHPVNQNVEISLTGAIGVIYAIVYYAIYFFVHRWLYGVFGIMTWWQVCLFQVLIWAYMFLAYWLQFPINRIFHKEESVFKEEQNTQKLPTLNGSLVNYFDSKLRTSFEDNTRL